MYSTYLKVIQVCEYGASVQIKGVIYKYGMGGKGEITKSPDNQIRSV